MWVLQKLCLALLFGVVFGWKTQLQVVNEKVTIDYVDHKYVDLEGEVFKFNATTNAIRGALTFKFDIPKNLRYYGAAYKWVNNGYNLNVGHLEDTVKVVSTMEYFGIADLCLRKTKPPAIWPLKKGVNYRTEAWTPDPSKFPPQFPDGKWKINARIFFANKTRISEVTWYMTTTYV